MMSKHDTVLRYKTAMAVFKSWLTNGLITKDELLAIDTKIALKYGLSLSSIYRNTDLICTRNNANMDSS